MAAEACSLKKPAGIYRGSCTGHGIGAAAGGPLAQHPTQSSLCLTAACGDPAIKLPLVQKNAQCYWPPTPLVPMPPAVVGSALQGVVLINKIVPILDQDLLTYHISPTMNTVITTCPGNPPTTPPTTCNCSVSLVVEDKNGIGHERKAVSTGKSVFVNKKRLCRVGDPLNGMHVGCLSLIGGGAVDVFVGD
jgi:hypothetical protein